jgi:hypothetical protein
MRKDRDVPHDQDAASADSDGDTSGTPDPALVTKITGRISQVKAGADAAAAALARDGDLAAALTVLDEIREQATQARRELRAVIGGRKAPAARPGGLREKILAHLDAHPQSELTPHEIHKVLGNSSGAIANALDTLVKLGEAELAAEKPRRFRRAGTAAQDEGDGTQMARNWRVPRENPRWRPGRHAAPAPRSWRGQQQPVLRSWLAGIAVAPGQGGCYRRGPCGRSGASLSTPGVALHHASARWPGGCPEAYAARMWTAALAGEGAARPPVVPW